MSIAPVGGIKPSGSGQSESVSTENAPVRSGNRQAGSTAGVSSEVEQSVSVRLPNAETTAARKIPPNYELPQDVVEVHQDPEIKNQIIIQYLDQARDVILQVPSNEELSVERGIAEESQEVAKQRQSEGAAAAGNKGEVTHGNQL
jgi:hypothetical protein